MPVRAVGERALLERLVANLVTNAVKYNGPGGRVTVTAGPGATVRVVNTGPVVPPDQVAGLFEPFRRLDADRTTRRVGTGLGLSIVRSVAAAHGGEVSAAPNPGGGLRISVDLPFQQVGVSDPRMALRSHGGD